MKNPTSLLILLSILFSFPTFCLSALESCKVGNTHQGIWRALEITGGHCYYYCGNQYNKYRIQTTYPAEYHDSINGYVRFAYYTTIWQASKTCPATYYSAGIGGENRGEQCWRLSTLAGYPPRIGETKPFTGMWSAELYVWECNNSGFINTNNFGSTCPDNYP